MNKIARPRMRQFYPFLSAVETSEIEIMQIIIVSKQTNNKRTTFISLQATIKCHYPRPFSLFSLILGYFLLVLSYHLSLWLLSQQTIQFFFV